jgi:hypothetical protein
VNSAGDQLLAGPRLPFDQHRHRRRCGALHELEDLQHRRSRADHLGESIAPREVALQHANLGAQSCLKGFELRVEARVLDGDGDAAGQDFEECEILFREDSAPFVSEADHSENAAPGLQWGVEKAWSALQEESIIRLGGR